MQCRLVKMEGGNRLWSCSDPWQWATLLSRSLSRDTEHLAVRYLASAFSQLPFGVQPAAVQAWVQREIRYERDRPPPGWGTVADDEPFERFSDPPTTIARAAGDCDDSARLVRAILRAMGWDARLVFLGTPRAPVHVTAALPTQTGWYWLDASLPARPGEHPSHARKRTRWTSP